VRRAGRREGNPEGACFPVRRGLLEVRGGIKRTTKGTVLRWAVKRGWEGAQRTHHSLTICEGSETLQRGDSSISHRNHAKLGGGETPHLSSKGGKRGETERGGGTANPRGQSKPCRIRTEERGGYAPLIEKHSSHPIKRVLLTQTYQGKSQRHIIRKPPPSTKKRQSRRPSFPLQKG